MMRVRLLACASLVLPVGLCLSEEPGARGRVNCPSAESNQRVVVTQDACRVFGAATNKMIDRIRLRKSAERVFATAKEACSSDCVVRGVRVEQISYLESNKVEAVFSCESDVRRGKCELSRCGGVN